LNDLRKKVVKGALSIGSLELFRYIVEISILVFTARVLSPTDFGIVAACLIVIGVADSFSDLGVKTALIQFKEDSHAYLDTAWTIQVLRALILFGLLFFASSFVAGYFEQDELKYVLPILALRPIIQALTNPMQTYHIRNVEYKKYSILTISGAISRILYIVPLTLFFRNYWAIVLGSILVTFTKTSVSYILDEYRPKFSLKNFSRLYNFGIWILFSRILFVGFKQLPSLIIGKMAGLDYLGGYKLADQGGNLITNIYKKFASFITIPFFSEKNRLDSDYRKSVENYLIMSIAIATPVSIFGALHAYEIVLIFLGEKWLFVSTILSYMFYIGGINFLALSFSSILISIGRPKADTISRAISFTVLVVGIIVSSNAIDVVESLLVASLIYLLSCCILLTKYYAFNQLRVLFGSAINVIPFVPSLFISSHLSGYNLPITILFGASVLSTVVIYISISYIFYRYFNYGLIKMVMSK